MVKEIHKYSETLSVLVIEDNLGDYVLIEDYLLEKFKGIALKHCSDYKSAVDYLQNSEEKISVILLDLNLPDIAGIDLINGIFDCNHDAPIIVLTGYSDLNMAKMSLQIGVYDYLVKDEINPMILYKTIIFALNRSDFIHQIETEKDNYENLFNFNPQPTWLLDFQELKILNANMAAQTKYGYSLDEFLDMSFTDLHPKTEREVVKHKLISRDIKLNSDHFTHQLSNGKEIKVDIYSRKIANLANDTLIVQSNDVSETLKHIQTIEVQNKKLRKIAWTQSHDVRAPLARILGIINLIEMDEHHSEEFMFLMKQLRLSGNEMDNLIKDIVDETSGFEKE